MRRAWVLHKRRTGASFTWGDVSDGDGPQRRALGVAYRDGEAITD